MNKVFFNLLAQDISLVDFIQDGADAGYTIKNLVAPEEEWSSPKFWHFLNKNPKEDSEHAKSRNEVIFGADIEKEQDIIANNNVYSYIIRLKRSDKKLLTLGCNLKKIGNIVVIKYAHTGANIFSLFNKNFRILSQNLVMITDFNNQIEFVNREWETLFGHSPEALSSLPISKLLHPKDLDRHKSILKNLINDPIKSEVFTSRLKKSDGTYAWVEWNTAVNPDYKVIYSVARDITLFKEREIAQAKYSASLFKLSKAKELANKHLHDFMKVLVQEAATQLQVKRFSFWKYLEDQDAIQIQFLYDGKPHSFENGLILSKASFPNYFKAISENRTLVAIHAEKDSRTAEFADDYLTRYNIKSMLDVKVVNRNMPIGVLCAEATENTRTWKYEEENYLSAMSEMVSAVYISHQKNNVESQLDRSEALYASLVNELPHFIYRADLNGKITFANQTVLDNLGINEKDIIGKVAYDFAPKEQSEKYRRDDKYLIKNKTVFRDIELHFFKGKNEARYVEVIKMPILDPEGNVKGIQGVFWDITEYKSKEIYQEKLLNTLKQQNKELVMARNNLEFINDFSTSILSLNTIDEMSKELVEKATQKYDLANCMVYIKSFDSDAFRLLPVFAVHNKELSQIIQNNVSTIISKVKQGMQPFTATANELFNDVALLSTVISIPIKVKDQLIGILIASYAQYKTSDNEVLENLKTLCSLVTMRIQHSRIEIKQKETYDELQKGRELYKSILAAIGEGLVFQNTDDKIEMTNAAAARILGLTEQQLLGKDSYDPQWQATNVDGSDLHPEMHPSMVTLRTGKPVDNFVMNVQTGKLERKYISINSRPVKDQNGILYGAVASFNDITEKKIAEAALKSSEKKYKSLFNNLPIGVLTFDVNGRVVDCNPEIVKILGTKEVELKNKFVTFRKYCDAFLDAEGRALRLNELPVFTSFKLGDTVNQEIVCLKIKDNKTENYNKKWLQLSSVPLLNVDNKVMQVVCSVVDITKLKHAENEVKRLAYVAEKSGEIILTCNSKGNIFWANAAIEDTLGYTPHEVLGTKPGEINKSYDTDEQVLKELIEALNESLHFNATVQGNKKDGSSCWINYEVTPIFDEQNKFLYSIVVMNDNTDLILRQKELERLLKATVDQNERLREYSYITSHNIRSSVANIMALSTFLLQEPDSKQYIELIHNTTKKLDVTIKNINQLLNLEEALQEKELVSCQLLEYVKRTLDLTQETIANKEAKITVHVPEDLYLMAIPAYLDSILHNLITNALKYGVTDTSKKIEISGYNKDQQVIILVKDNGIGIDTIKFKEKLFKLGSRFHEQHSDGQGMGLFMTKRQVESLGGSISVESKKGLYTIFKIYLGIHDKKNTNSR